MLLGQKPKRTMAIKVQKPLGSISGKTQGASETSQGKSQRENGSHTEAGKTNSRGVDKLQRDFGQPTKRKRIYSSE